MSGGIGLDAITIDCADPVALAGFWAAILGTEVESTLGDAHYIDLASRPGLPHLRFHRVPERKAVKNRLHFDLMAEDIEAAADHVERLGGRRTGESHTEYDYTWIVLTDPEDNEFCVGRKSSG
jgi:predicted enzyme related to lactoylglutathione lyase